MIRRDSLSALKTSLLVRVYLSESALILFKDFPFPEFFASVQLQRFMDFQDSITKFKVYCNLCKSPIALHNCKDLHVYPTS